MATLIARNPRRPGAARLRALVEAEGRFSTVTKSHPEEAVLALTRRAGLPEPEINSWLGPYEVDCLWRSERLIVEIDGYEFHSTRWSFEADHERDVELESYGFEVIRFTEKQITKQPERVLVRLARRLGQS